jgi:hypothetical protein
MRMGRRASSMAKRPSHQGHPWTPQLSTWFPLLGKRAASPAAGPAIIFAKPISLVSLLAAGACAAFALLLAPAATHGAGRAKIIEWGWDMPSPQFVQANIAAMEQQPFDGVTIKFHYGTATDNEGNFSRHVFSSTPLNFNDATLQSGINALKAIPFRTLTDNFLDIYMSYWGVPAIIDWFDDWSPYLNNVKVAVRVAKQAGLRGIILDTESYHPTSHMWKYTVQKYRSTKTFAEYQAQVAQRGRELMEAVIAEYPEAVVLLSFGPSTVAFYKSEITSHTYGLVPVLVDGMLQALEAQREARLPMPTLIDGYAISYSFKTLNEITVYGYDYIRTHGRALSSVPTLYDQFLRAGFGKWMDNASNASDCAARNAWSTTNFTCNWFTPEEFKTAVFHALSISESYVWVWSERLNWWTGENLPKAYVDALRGGKNLYLNSLP